MCMGSKALKTFALSENVKDFMFSITDFVIRLDAHTPKINADICCANC